MTVFTEDRDGVFGREGVAGVHGADVATSGGDEVLGERGVAETDAVSQGVESVALDGYDAIVHFQYLSLALLRLHKGRVQLRNRLQVIFLDCRRQRLLDLHSTDHCLGSAAGAPSHSLSILTNPSYFPHPPSFIFHSLDGFYLFKFTLKCGFGSFSTWELVYFYPKPRNHT